MNYKWIKKYAKLIFVAIMLTQVSAVTIPRAMGDDGIQYEELTNGAARCAVTADLSLPDTFGGQEILWSSDDSSVIANDGSVTRPPLHAQSVTLTAAYGGQSQEFTFRVPGEADNVIYSTEFDSAEELDGYSLLDQGATVRIGYDAASGTIPGQYATVSVEEGKFAKIKPTDDNRMSMLSPGSRTDILTGTVVIEKNIRVTNGFDLEIKNSAGRRIAKLQAANGKMYNYSNFNTVAETVDCVLPTDFFTLGIVADTELAQFDVLINGEVVNGLARLSFMAESDGAENIAANDVNLGVYPRNSENNIYIDYESILVENEIPNIEQIKDLLTDSLILQENSSLDEVESDLLLLSSYDGLYGAEILWKSSNESVCSTQGQITRQTVDTPVQLCAVIDYSGVQAEKIFQIIVKAEQVSEELTQAETAVSAAIISGDDAPCAVTQTLNLPRQWKDVTIEWKSSNEAVISSDGTVIRPDISEKIVELTAVYRRNGEELIKSYVFSVPAQDTNVVYSTDFDSINSLGSYMLTEQNIAEPALYDEQEGKILGAYATVSHEISENTTMAVITPSDAGMSSMLSRRESDGALDGLITVEKRILVSEGFDLEIKNSQGRRIAKLQAAGDKLHSYSNYNTVEKTVDHVLPTGFFMLKVVINTETFQFDVYIDGTPVEGMTGLPFMSESLSFPDVAANAILLGVYPRNASNYIRIDYEALKAGRNVMTQEQISDAISEELIKGRNRTLAQVTQPLNLQSKYDEAPGAEIEWESSSPAVASDGQVVRERDDDAKLTLTATIKYDGELFSKTFDVTVQSYRTELTERAAQLTASTVTGFGDTPQSVKEDLNLDAANSLFDGAAVEWSSDSPDVIANDGTVICPAFTDAEVTLTARITQYGLTVERQLQFIVKSNIGIYTFPDGGNLIISGVSESVGADFVQCTMQLRLDSEGMTEPLSVVMCLVDKNDTSFIAQDIKSVNLTGTGDTVVSLRIDGVDPVECQTKYYMWDSLENHMPLLNSAPSAPQRPAASENGGVVELVWQEAVDDHDEITSYQIYGDGMYLGETAGTSFEDANLDKGQSKEYEIYSVDENGQVSPSAVINAGISGMDKCIANGDEIILPEDRSVNCYIETATYKYGYSEAAVAGGVACRTTTEQDYNGTKRVGFIPFVLSDNFLNENANITSFAVEFTYFDEGAGTINLQYDNTSGELRGSNTNVSLTNSGQWKTAMVTLTDAAFKKSSNSGNSYANLRIGTANPGFRLRALGITPLSKYTYDAAGFTANELYAEGRRASVYGVGAPVIVAGKAALMPEGKLIEIRTDIIEAEKLEVYFYDETPDEIVLTYINGEGVETTQRVKTDGSGKWRRACFNIPDAALSGALQGESGRAVDFAIGTVSGGKLCLNSVRIY